MTLRLAKSVKQIQKLDEVAINQYGVPSLALMENAGHSVADEVISSLKSKKGNRVSIFCGLGNNAGDGFVVARHLINTDRKVNIFLIGKGSRLKADAAVNYSILKRLKYPIREISRVSKEVQDAIKKSDVIVDAIFGVGLNRIVGEPFRSFIDTINKSKSIVSVDTPSGLDGTTGKIYGVCIKANKTVTFTFAKKGFYKNDGPKYTGRVVVIDIGIPKRLKDKLG